MFTTRFQRSLSALVLLAAATTAVVEVRAGTKVIVGRAVAPPRRASLDKIDHRVWTALLNKYVDQAGRVNYRGWQKSAGDVAALDRYLSELSRGDSKIRTSREGYLAFWINAYNAVTIKGILREYPTSSIRNHTARLYGYNIWKDLLLVVGDHKISLHDIEHEVLRKAGDPRIHFAIVCASHSCPRLLKEAYVGNKIEQQFTTNARHFFANPENFQYRDGTFHLSPIMKWFAEDFGKDAAAQLRGVAAYLPDQASRQAASSGSGRIAYLGYDWSLNDQATRSARR